MKLKPADRTILAALQQDGRVTNVALSARTGMSESACLRRIRNMERAGVISGYAAVLDQRALDLTVTAFVLVSVEKQPTEGPEAFHDRVRAERHIVECHATSGTHDYLLKVVARDMDHFAALVMEGILKYPNVRHVESGFSLRKIKSPQPLPL